MVAGVPSRYPISLNGVPYLVDLTKRYQRASIPLQRPQADTSGLPGEQTLNTEDLWRRSLETWHWGEGQTVFDRPGSDPRRYRRSLGIDPWEQWQLTLLAETERKKASTNADLHLAVAGGYLYAGDGQTLAYTEDILADGTSTWTTVTGTPAAAINALATNGKTIWAAYGTEGIYSTDRGDAAATEFSFLDADALAYVKGRLMTAFEHEIYNVTGSSAPITYRATSDLAWFVSSNISPRDVSVPMPAGIQEGDLLILNIFGVHTTSGEGSISVTNDWTLLDSTTFEPSGASRVLHAKTYFKIASASESAVVVTSTYNIVASFDMRAVIVAYDAAKVDGPIDVHSQGTNTGSVSVTAPAVTTPVDESMLVFLGHGVRMGGGGTSFTTPTGFTERADVTWLSGSDSYTSTFAEKEQAAAGSSGTVTATAANAVHSIAHLIAIRPNVPEALLTHDNADFRWVGFAEGLNDIYAAGFSGDKSLIYRTQVRPDGTALDVPVVAGRLPDGEIARSIYGYLGFIFVGTDRGLRMATSDANGDLTFGSLIETPSPVRSFEGQGPFVWFGFEDFDASWAASGTYDGLGRLDLREYPSPLTPAYASDLMVTGSTSTTEQVTSIVTFQERRVFAIADSAAVLSRGVYAERAVKVANGYLDSGRITYDISDPKIAAYLEVRHEPLVGDVQAYLSADSGAFASIGTSSTAGTTKPAASFDAGPTTGDHHELRVRLGRASITDQIGPTLTRLTLRSEPAPSRGTFFRLPIILYDYLQDETNQLVRTDIPAALTTLFALLQTRVVFEDRGISRNVFVRDIEFEAEDGDEDRQGWGGIAWVTVKEVAA